MFRDPTQYKYIYPWFKSHRNNYLMDHALPWLTFDAINYLKAHVQNGSNVFEYGSGSSTLFWANRNARCISIEHDPTWYDILKQRFKPSDDVDLRLIPPDLQRANDLAPDDPRSYRSRAAEFADRTFHEYVAQIDSFPDGYFDVVLVDGRARASCVLHSVSKVKSGGMLILDNADMPRHLARTAHLLDKFTLHRFIGIAPIIGVISQTNIYIAP